MILTTKKYLLLLTLILLVLISGCKGIENELDLKTPEQMIKELDLKTQNSNKRCWSNDAQIIDGKLVAS